MCPQNPAQPVTPRCWIRQGMRNWLCPKPHTCQDNKDSAAAAPLQASPAQGELVWSSCPKLGLLLALIDAQCHFSGGKGFGHSTASSSKLGWGCQEVLGAGGATPLCLATPGHPAHAGHLPRHQNCRILLCPKQEHPTVLARLALPGITGIPWSTAPPAQMGSSSENLAEALGSDPRALPSPGFPCLRLRTQGLAARAGLLGAASGTPGHPRAAARSPGLG